MAWMNGREDYIAFMTKLDMGAALRNLAASFTHYNAPIQLAGVSLSEGIQGADGIVNLFSHMTTIGEAEHTAVQR